MVMMQSLAVIMILAEKLMHQFHLIITIGAKDL